MRRSPVVKQIEALSNTKRTEEAEKVYIYEQKIVLFTDQRENDVY